CRLRCRLRLQFAGRRVPVAQARREPRKNFIHLSFFRLIGRQRLIGCRNSCFHVPASTAVTALRKEPDERMTSFSTSTTRKNASPPAKSQGQTQSGIASFSNSRCRGGA